MNYRKFSDTGWNVSEIGLGCWAIGGSWTDVSEKDAIDNLYKALDEGVNFFDTSDAYGKGRSEKLIGKFINSISEKVYIATKVGTNLKPNIPDRYTIENFEKFVDQSLLNLGVETIDLLQLHCPPRQLCSKKETYEIMDEFVRKGKIKYYGVSVFKISEAMEAIKFSNVKSIQLVFNLFRQRPAEHFFKEAKKKSIAIIARGPLASGLLTGTINQNTKFSSIDHRNFNISGKTFDIGDTFSGVNLKKGLEAIERLKKLLPKNYSLIDIALKWILSNSEVSVVIPGATNKLQVKMNTSASDKENIDELLPEINSIYEEFIKPDVHEKW